MWNIHVKGCYNYQRIDMLFRLNKKVICCTGMLCSANGKFSVVEVGHSYCCVEEKTSLKIISNILFINPISIKHPLNTFFRSRSLLFAVTERAEERSYQSIIVHIPFLSAYQSKTIRHLRLKTERSKYKARKSRRCLW